MNSVLKHHGILGQKWGIRRYQNPDGSLTEAGKKRYDKKVMSYNIRKMNRDFKKSPKLAYENAEKKRKALEEIADEYEEAYKKASADSTIPFKDVLKLWSKSDTANGMVDNWVLQMTAVFSKMSLEDLKKNDIDEGFHYINDFFTNPNNKDALDWLEDEDD